MSFLHAIMTAQPMLAYYGWYFGWWWWWWILILFFWVLVLPPFGWGRRWYGTYRTRYGVRTGPVGTGSPADMEYGERWAAVESHFLESPDAAVREADELIGALVAQRHGRPAVTDDYRAAHEIALKSQRGEATTDELRRVMLAYRSLFEQLMNSGSR